MGCAISRVHSRIIDSSKPISNVNIQIVDNPNLNTYFTDTDNPNPKCIFIFGGSGSNKGEFIWELLQRCESYESSESVSQYVYHYIDVEKLILDNIGKRIKKLTTEKTAINSTNANQDGHESREISMSETSIRSNASDDLKTKMLLYANIVTNNWVLGLISKEINRHVVETTKKVFIVNLIPNRINMFRNCLYLKQAPSFVNFHFNYIAINLVKSNSKRKDLDQLPNNSGYDEVNSNFINYFRLINKLIEIKVEHDRAKLKIKVTKNKNAIKIVSNEDLLSFIHMPKKDGMEINISEFDYQQNNFQSSLIFVIKNEIDLDQNEVLVFDENDVKVETVKQFTQLYIRQKDCLKCDLNNSQTQSHRPDQIQCELSHN